MRCSSNCRRATPGASPKMVPSDQLHCPRDSHRHTSHRTIPTHSHACHRTPSHSPHICQPAGVFPLRPTAYCSPARWTCNPVTERGPEIIIPGLLKHLTSSTASSARILPRQMISGGGARRRGFAGIPPPLLGDRPCSCIHCTTDVIPRHVRHVNAATSRNSLCKSFGLAAALTKHLPRSLHGRLRHLRFACAQHQAGQHCKDAFERSDYFLVSHLFFLSFLVP